MKNLRYLGESAILTAVMAIFRILPLDAASAAGGWLGRTIGQRLAASRKALRNVVQALPDLSPTERQAVIAGMWDNLGRVMAEYPHLEKIGRERVTYEVDPAAAKLFEQDKPCMMAGAHLANWETGGVSMLFILGKQVDLTYRAPNNPRTDRLLMKARTLNGKIRAYPKSRSGGQELIKAMRAGHYVGMLIDQKYNEGLAVPFFGRPAMTNPAFAQLAAKFAYPVIPWQAERIAGAHFKITVHAPITAKDRPVEDVIAETHAHLENWIRQRPEQWLWLHRRWDSEKLKEIKESA